MNGNNLGAGVLALGALRRVEIEARRANEDAIDEANAAIAARDTAINEKNRLMFAAKSQIHGLRARIEGHTLTENDLIAALKAENPDHPLASRSAVDLLIEGNRAKAMYDLTVARKTYPSGEIPEGSITIWEDGSPSVVGGQPGYEDASLEQQRVNLERAAMLKAANLDGRTILDPARVMQSIVLIQEFAAQTQQRLDEDDKKGFFGSMKKNVRKEVEDDLAHARRYVVMLNEALPKAEEYVSRQAAKLG